MTGTGDSAAAKGMDKGTCGCAPKAATAEGTGGCCGGHGDHAGQGHHHATAKADVLDPVCGMTVDPATSKHRFDHKGTTYHFCSAGCRSKFAADPAKYLDKAAAPPAEMPEGTIY